MQELASYPPRRGTVPGPLTELPGCTESCRPERQDKTALYAQSVVGVTTARATRYLVRASIHQAILN